MNDNFEISLNRSNPVEINGVRFETEIQSIIKIPILPGRSIPVILGIGVTNKTSTCLYFPRVDSLMFPNCIDSNNRIIEGDSDMLRPRVKGKPYYLVSLGEREFFSYESFLSRGFFQTPRVMSFCQLQFKFYNEAGGFFYFRNLKSGKYRLQLFLSYPEIKTLASLPPSVQNLAIPWTGKATLLFVEFQLVF
ncbi:hypothetical protein [Crocosphaera sp. Alani8]|uniref:hypothetical protein n=1 Tax=Crocosphaera sp. Alani8 TaxID=3038952 RepID=UPI00313DBFEF